MQQKLLPLIPHGSTQINDLVSVWRDDKKWTYFLGTHPIYSHESEDERMFKLVTSLLIDSGSCRQARIIETFGVSKSSVIRASKKLREGGPEAFFERRTGRRGGTVLTQEVIEKARNLLDQGVSRKETAEELNVAYDTLRKAINDGRLQESKHHEVAISKSSRTVVDAEAAQSMGTACTRVDERVLASLGKCIGAPVQFELSLDVPNGGVLCALPALLENGLLNNVDQLLGKMNGYYTTFQILLLLAFMSLCRIKRVEQLRKCAPGEFGNLLGLDRIPEARCLRNKMDALSSGDGAELWAAQLSQHWLQSNYEAVGTLYIDGHVRVYHGHLTELPRRYVSRERLCLRGVTDYWVNDAIGLPFFVVEQEVDPGLLNVLRDDIVPRLLKDAPSQHTEEDLEANPLLCRFLLVFDREGYSPAFFAEMWQNHRVACMTYHKFPGEDWPVALFTEEQVTMPACEVVNMSLCEMGSLVGAGKTGVWMREVRKLTDSGHQTSVISTAFELDHLELAGRMFSRWCQENFFRYMLQHFDIDQLIEYGTEDFPDTERVVNPTWRELNRERNSVTNKLRYRRARFAEMTMHPETEENPAKYAKWVNKKSELLEEIEHYEHRQDVLKQDLKETEKHIAWAELDDNDKFQRLLPGRRRLMDTIHMIAYRTETAMTGLVIGPTIDSAAARALLQDLFVTEADIIPDVEAEKLVVRVHCASTPAANRAFENLLTHLNEAEVKYPGTDMQIVYELAGHTDSTHVNGVT